MQLMPASGSYPALVRLMQERRWNEALALIDAELARDPAQAPLRLHRAQALLALGQTQRALRAADEALPFARLDAAMLDALGTVYSFGGDQRRALAAYDAAVTLAPRQSSHRYNRAAVRRFLGDLAGAESDYDQVIALRPDDFEAYRSRSDLRPQTAQHNHIAQLERLVSPPPADWRAAVQVRYALAKEYEDLGEYRRSFAQLALGAALRRGHMHYDVATDVATVDWIMEAFASPLSRDPVATASGPIFIVGMPRTGTTLVERILSSHPEVSAAGELNDFAVSLVRAAQPPGAPPLERRELVARSAHLNFEALGAQYLQRASAALGWDEHSTARRFTDKMPLNFLYCGLIQRSLPHARIVHMTRHPMATCYAMFKTLFKDAYPFSYDLGELGQYYLAYRRLMEHWHRLLPGMILDVSYEALVRHQEPETRRLLQFCGLPWEEACLQFHRNATATTTASATQVRRPLYDTSVDQWRHYHELLRPLEDALRAGGLPI